MSDVYPRSKVLICSLTLWSLTLLAGAFYTARLPMDYSTDELYEYTAFQESVSLVTADLAACNVMAMTKKSADTPPLSPVRSLGGRTMTIHGK